MKSFISEDDIEQTICNRLSKPEYGWTRIECDPSPNKKDDVSKTGRKDAQECILPEVFRAALRRLNPQVDAALLDEIVKEFRRNYSGAVMEDVNYRFYNKIRNGIKVNTKRNGKDDFEIVKVVDFDNVDRNDFHCVNQMWIKGQFNYRRPDVLLFVNGLPVVFIELKKSTVKLEEAFQKNLLTYREEIPNIFALNQICVLSNGHKTKLGAWNSKYEFFFEWLKVDDEHEAIDRKKVAESGLSIVNLMNGLFRKERLLDYIENFIFFDNQKVKT